MIPSWLVFTVLAVLAICFILWPIWRFKHVSHSSAAKDEGVLSERLQTNIQLFQEHMAELDAALAEGRLDTAQFEQLKLEQERNLLEDEASLISGYRGQNTKLGWITLCATCLLLMCLALILYLRWGSAPDVALYELQAEKNQLDREDLSNNREPDPKRVLELISAVETRLEDKPESTQYWFLLARSAMEIGDYPRAISAYEKILPLDPKASIVMGELAQAMFLRDKNRTSPAIEQLVQSALQVDPQNTTALGLAGIAAFERKDFNKAAEYWQRAVAILGVDAPGASPLLGGIARARAEAAKAGTTSPQPEVAGTARSISVQVKFGADVNLPGNLPVFVYARAWQGARMPLAIQRITLADLPANLTLDESMAMSPAMSLAQADQVEVVARVALDGTATAKAGDWQGSIGPLDLDNLPAEIVINIDQKLSE